MTVAVDWAVNRITNHSCRKKSGPVALSLLVIGLRLALGSWVRIWLNGVLLLVWRYKEEEEAWLGGYGTGLGGARGFGFESVGTITVLLALSSDSGW